MQDDQSTQPTATSQAVDDPSMDGEETRIMEAPVESSEAQVEAATEETDALETATSMDEEDVMTAETTDEDDEAVTTSSANPDTEKAFSILQIEDLINRQMADIEKMRDDVKLLKSSYDDIFKNDAKYREFDDKMKEAKKLLAGYKQAMMKDPSVAAANSSFMLKRDELKDLQIGLSDYLREYNRISGLTQFETKDGQVLEIVQTFKLVKK